MKFTKHSGLNLLFALLALCALLIQPGMVQAAKNDPFSADHITVTPDGKEIKGKIYAGKNHMRMEMNQPGMPFKMIVIASEKDKTATMLNMQAKRYWVMPLDQSSMAGLIEKEPDMAKRKKLGTETVNGFKCTKYLLTNEVNMMGVKKEVEVTVWEAKEIRFPIRSETKDGVVQELRNVKMGEPPAKLFKVPAGFTKANNMMELMMPTQ